MHFHWLWTMCEVLGRGMRVGVLHTVLEPSKGGDLWCLHLLLSMCVQWNVRPSFAMSAFSGVEGVQFVNS